MTLVLDAVRREELTEWDLRNLRVSDERLSVLERAYTDLALSNTHSAVAPEIERSRRQSDAEHASIMRELERHREHVCRECEGRTWVQNPEARYERDWDTGNYETNDPEEIECPHCGGVGYEPPERKANAPLPVIERDDGEPF